MPNNFMWTYVVWASVDLVEHASNKNPVDDLEYAPKQRSHKRFPKLGFLLHMGKHTTMLSYEPRHGVIIETFKSW